MRLGVRLGAQHELARRAVERRLGRRGGPAGHSNSPLRIACPKCRAQPVDRLVTLQQLILELHHAPFELGDPVAVGLGRERGARDRRQLGGDLAAELLAELSLEQPDHGLLAAQLRGLVGGLDRSCAAVCVARRDGFGGVLVVGGRELLLDLLLEVAVLGVVDELHAHAGAARERRPVKRDALVDHHTGGVQHRRALLLRDQPMMLESAGQAPASYGSSDGSIAITFS